MLEELRASGHQVTSAPPSSHLDVTDRDAMEQLIMAAVPDGVIHLAGVAYAGDANRDPINAMRVNEGGTRTLFDALARRSQHPAVIVAGSSEVYGRPAANDLPLRESAPIHADSPYARSKFAQERAAVEAAKEHEMAVIVTRSFNMTGPGQRRDFVAPALASRLLEARRRGAGEIAVGNLEVRRDIGDVRDSVRAYRLLLEALAEGSAPSGASINVATGRSVTIRRVFEMLRDILGVSTQPRLDPSLTRASDAPEIVGDASTLRKLTGWTPTIPLERTLADLVADLAP
jgi:GDP-4-dehydro-6-deoxy-D-mannose reductase